MLSFEFLFNFFHFFVILSNNKIILYSIKIISRSTGSSISSLPTINPILDHSNCHPFFFVLPILISLLLLPIGLLIFNLTLPFPSPQPHNFPSHFLCNSFEYNFFLLISYGIFQMHGVLSLSYSQIASFYFLVKSLS